MLSLQSDQELRHTIGLYGPALQPDQWPPASVLSGFSGAEVYKFTAHAQNYALKIWPSSERSVSKLEALKRLLEDIYQRGITYIAPPIRKTDGDVATITSSGRLIHIEPWLTGESVSEIPFSPQKQKNAMQALARWHLTAANHVPKPEHFSWIRPAYEGNSPGLKHRLSKLEHYLKTGIPTERQSLALSEILSRFHLRLQTVFRFSAADLWEELKNAHRQKLPLQPVLKDIWRDHVLFTEDKVSGLIDPAAFGTDSVLTDISRLLGSIAGNKWNLWAEAISDYHAVRPLSHTEKKLVGVFDHSNLLLSAIGCYERCLKISFTRDDSSTILQPRLFDRLDEYLKRLETYRKDLQ